MLINYVDEEENELIGFGQKLIQFSLIAKLDWIEQIKRKVTKEVVNIGSKGWRENIGRSLFEKGKER